MAININDILTKDKIILVNDKGKPEEIKINRLNDSARKTLKHIAVALFDKDKSKKLEQGEQKKLYARLKPYLADGQLTNDEIAQLKSKLFSKKKSNAEASKKFKDKFEELNKRAQELIGVLYRINEAEQREAAWELAEMGNLGAFYLTDFLERERLVKHNVITGYLAGRVSLNAQKAGVAALAEIGSGAAGAVPVLTEIVKTPGDLTLRQMAVAALYKIGSASKPAVDTLAKILSDEKEDETLRKAALWALGGLGPTAKGAIPVLKNMLGSQGASFRVALAWAIVCIDPAASKEAVAVLKNELINGDGTNHITAALGLVKINKNYKPAIAALEKALRNSDDFSRIIVAEELIKINSIAKKAAFDALVELLNNQNADVRREAVKSLLKLGPLAKEAIFPLTCTMLNDSDRFIRNIAKKTLKKTGALPESEIYAMIDIIKNENEGRNKRKAAIYALGNMGIKAKKAIPYLIYLFDKSDWEMSNAIVGALAAIGKPAVDDLRIGLQARSAGVRIYSAMSLSKMGSAAIGAVNDLIKALDDNNITVVEESTKALGNIGKPAKPAVPKILKILKNKDKYIDNRTAAAKALSKIDPQNPAVVRVFKAILGELYEDDDLKDIIRKILYRIR